MSPKLLEKEIETLPAEGRRYILSEIGPIGIVLLAFLTLAGVYLSQPGLAWDEALYIPYAEECRQWFVALPATFNWPALHDSLGRFMSHPPLAIYTMAASIQALGNSIGILYAARVASVMSMAALLVAVYFFTLRTTGVIAATAACFFLVTIPQFFEYGILATLEMPTALWWFAAAALFYAAMENRKLAWVAGLAAALAFFTKIHGAALPLVLWPWGIYFYGRKAMPAIVWSIVLAPLVFFVGWPFLWAEPFVGAGKYFGEKFGVVVSLYNAMGIDLKTAGDAVHRMIRRTDVSVLYFGKVYVAAPWHYSAVMAFITVPLATTMSAAAGIVGMLRANRHAKLLSLVGWNIAFWFIAFSCGLSRPYDGLRLLCVIFPFVAILAGIGVQSIWECVPRGVAAKGAAAIVALIVAGTLVWSLLSYAPFGISYYNVTVGGLRGAAGKGLPVTYWGETTDYEIASYIDSHAPYGARLAAFPMDRQYVENMRFFGIIRPDIKDVSTSEDWDYLIVVNRGDALAGRDDIRILTEQAVAVRKVQGVPSTWLVEKKR